MSRFYGYHCLAHHRADAAKPSSRGQHRPMPRRDEDWDKGALLIIAIVALPVALVAGMAVLLAM